MYARRAAGQAHQNPNVCAVFMKSFQFQEGEWTKSYEAATFTIV
jgi:hypothetical protein